MRKNRHDDYSRGYSQRAFDSRGNREEAQFHIPRLTAHVRERFGVTIIAVNSPDGGILVNPPAATTNQSGDRLRVFGLPKQIAEFEIYVGAKAKA
jgi:Trk K+ transport system NAD-binding subunit